MVDGSWLAPVRIRRAAHPWRCLGLRFGASYASTEPGQVRRKRSWEAFESKLTGELKAAFLCCKAVVPSMIENKTGCIIAISSGLSRHPGLGFCAHSTAKSGLDAFMKSLALELGPHGIRVNVVAPGLTETDATKFLPKEHKARMANMAPLRRIAQPDDVAGAVYALACEQARFLTGVYVPVSGGTQML
jgi:3-oxoacyl-[acyl-carrier protein] reductase